MLRRWFSSFTTQPPAVRAWALLLWVAYAYWAALLLALSFGLDDRLDRDDLPALAVGIIVGAPLLATIATLTALQTSAPTRTRWTGFGALLAYNLTTVATTTGMLVITATPTDLHKLFAPLLLVALLVNGLVMWRWGKREADPWTAWGVLLVAGALTVGAGWAGLRAPMDVQTTVRDVPITLTAPEGRLLNTCRPVTWNAGVPKPWDAFVRVGLDGATLHRTLDIGTVSVCPYTASTTPGDPGRVIVDIPVMDNEAEMHREWLDFAVVTVTQVRVLVLLAVVKVLLPPVALVGGGWVTGRHHT